jgi:hypothetical protein
MSTLAFESVSCLAMSLAVNSALIVVAVAPDRRMPWNATANAELLGASADPAIGQGPGERIDAGDHLAIGGLPAGLRVDKRDPIEVGLVDAAEQIVVDARRWDVDFGEGTRETHGASDRFRLRRAV